MQVVLSDAEIKAGLKLAPTQKEVTITDQPVDKIKFSQFRATVAGTITCLGKNQIDEQMIRVDVFLLFDDI